MNVELSKLLHDDRSAYVLEGYGGKGIAQWPFFYFIRQFFDDDEVKAKNRWVDWLIDQHSKYGSFEKKNGGMYGGSVQKYALDIAGCQSPADLTDADIKHGAISLVERRIAMMRSIRDEGFNAKKNGRVIALKVLRDKKIYYVMKGGHHRAAVLFALGYASFPNVLVVAPTTYKFLHFGRKVVNSIRKRIL